MGQYLKYCIVALTCSLWVGAAHPSWGMDVSEQRPAPQQSRQTGASILIPSATFDFGEALEGSVVSHDFIVKNTGTDTLEISKVKPG
jgi:hypothetical protein